MRRHLPILGLLREEVVENLQRFRLEVVHVSCGEVTDRGALETSREAGSARCDLPRFFPNGGRGMQLAGGVAPAVLVTRFMLIAELGIQNGFAVHPLFGERIFQTGRFKIPPADGPLHWILYS